MTSKQLISLAIERESYGDTREALELRQKAKRAALIEAAQLERDADILNSSLLAWSMTEQAMRDEAKALRETVAGR